MKKLALVMLMMVALAACAERELRGYVKPSADGGTYLVVEDDNGGKCGPMILNGKEWMHPIGKPGAVQPGEQILECGAAIGFTVEAGTTFYVDYWGP